MKMAYVALFSLTSLLAVILSGHAMDSWCDERGALTEKVKRVFDHLGVTVSTICQANEFAQKNLLRMGERWDAQAKSDLHSVMIKNEETLRRDLLALGMLDSVECTRAPYAYALVMGSLRETMSERLAWLKDLLRRGVGFKRVCLLSGERQLQADEKTGLPVTITTESQLMQHLCGQDSLLRDLDLLLINALPVPMANGGFARPTTDATLVEFAKAVPAGGTCLVVSNNPYVRRQTLVARRILGPAGFLVTGTGPFCDEDIVMLMDEFARVLFEEYRQFAHR